MSSNFRKDFTTTDATKAGGAEVVSDSIDLSPRTKNHVLVVKSDSSVSGTVDVELEMSPDGINWCPAVNKKTASTSSDTGDLVGNEKNVKLTPDGGENKNKHGRGLMTYNLGADAAYSGSEGTEANRTDGADLMYHRIQTTKSFNYSQWIKSSTAPSATYKPVLFRHAGYDNFANAKVVQTDSNTVTQNLCNAKSATAENDGAVESDPSPDNKLPTGGVLQDDDSYDLTTNAWSVGFWFKSNTDVGSGGTPNFGTKDGGGSFSRTVFISTDRASSNFYGGLYFQVFSATSVSAGWAIDGGNGTFDRLYTTSAQQSANQSDAGGDFLDGAWHHFMIVKDSASAPNLSSTTGLKYYLDGALLLHDFNTFGSPALGSVIDKTTICYGRVLEKFADGSTVLTSHNARAYSSFTEIGKMDNVCFWKSDQSSNAAAIYNSGKPLTTNPGTPTTYLRFEDSSNLDTNSVTGSAVSISKSSATKFNVQQEVLTDGADSIFVAGLPTLNDHFDISTNLSISGWVKTTDTGTLFSNTDGAAADGMKLEVNATNVVLHLIDSSQTVTATADVDDGEWHHIAVVKPSGATPTIKIYVDGVEKVSTAVSTITNNDVKGTNGFTLLADGQQNDNAASPAGTDSSKLAGSISNWSIHTEALSANAILQLYSNGNVRNIKNLPDVTAGSIKAWWQLNGTSSSDILNDNSASNADLAYEDGGSAAVSTKSVTATGAALIADGINGHGMTMSITKSFNFTTKKWVSTADQDAAICLSFNGFEEQSEYHALWKCSQTLAGSAVNVMDGNHHNIILSYRGKNDFSGDNVDPGDVVKFGPGTSTQNYNWTLSIDGVETTTINDGSGVDYIGGLNTITTATYGGTLYNVGFAIRDRHLKHTTSNTEEVYKPHTQFSSGILDSGGSDNIYAFQGNVDETSFHSDCWWVNEAGSAVVPNNFNGEKPATIYGNTTALSNRGAGKEYPSGAPYPLRNPEKLNTTGEVSDIQGTNQYINPDPFHSVTNSTGGLEGWWRWGDTSGDCSVTINDVKSHADGNNNNDLSAENLTTADVIDLTSSDSTYIASSTSSAGISTTFPQVKLAAISAGLQIFNIVSPVLQFLRVKWKGAGSVDLGSSKGEASIYYTNRTKRRKK